MNNNNISLERLIEGLSKVPEAKDKIVSSIGWDSDGYYVFYLTDKDKSMYSERSELRVHSKTGEILKNF